jgi:hypothetical protein
MFLHEKRPRFVSEAGRRAVIFVPKTRARRICATGNSYQNVSPVSCLSGRVCDRPYFGRGAAGVYGMSGSEDARMRDDPPAGTEGQGDRRSPLRSGIEAFASCPWPQDYAPSEIAPSGFWHFWEISRGIFWIDRPPRGSYGRGASTGGVPAPPTGRRGGLWHETN